MFRPFLADDMPIHCRGVHAPADASAQPHRLVRETEAEPSTAAQATKWGAPESSSHLGLPYRSSCVFSHLTMGEHHTDHVTYHRLRYGLRGELHDRPLLSREQSQRG
jgi:hypothetical protein